MDIITSGIINYFHDTPDIFGEAVEQLDAYNGFLCDDRYYDMDELDDLYNDAPASEILCRAYYGHDEDDYTTDASGHRSYAPFCPNRDYFRFDGYGNLVSSNYKDYSDRLAVCTVEMMLENLDEIDAIAENDELAELFAALAADNAKDCEAEMST